MMLRLALLLRACIALAGCLCFPGEGNASRWRDPFPKAIHGALDPTGAITFGNVVGWVNAGAMAWNPPRVGSYGVLPGSTALPLDTPPPRSPRPRSGAASGSTPRASTTLEAAKSGRMLATTKG